MGHLLYKWPSLPLSSLISSFLAEFSPDFTGHFPRQNLKQTVGSWASGPARGLLSNSIFQKGAATSPSLHFSALTCISSSDVFLFPPLSLCLSPLSCLCELLPGYWIYKSVNVTLPCIYWSCPLAHPVVSISVCITEHTLALVIVHWALHLPSGHHVIIRQRRAGQVSCGYTPPEFEVIWSLFPSLLLSSSCRVVALPLSPCLSIFMFLTLLSSHLLRHR